MKNIKKVTVTLAMAAVLACSAAAPATSVYAASTSCSQTKKADTFTKGKLCYKVTGKNTCTVTGLSKSGKKSSSCTIPSTVTCKKKTYKVTKVAAKAFKNCDNLTTVKVCNNVTTVGNNAFAGCDNLSQVTLGNSVCNVNNNAFAGCNNLDTITCGNPNVAAAGNNCWGNAVVQYNGSCNR